MQPEKLGRYQIVGVLGRGGMGVVYEGHDPQIDRSVAIKTIALAALDERETTMFEARFRAEMRSAGRLQHHNIAAIYDTGRDGGTAYIVMELVTGHDLKWHLAAGERFSIQRALAITLQLLAALDYAHRRQVIHRDVKPANVMLQSDGVVKLCDFGVARLADADATRTQGMVVGSLRYASPEQILGQTIDARTDVFSAGVLLFELLTGTLPFKGKSDVEILHRITTEAAPSPRTGNPDIPVDISAAVQRAMAKNPDDRFGSAGEFAQALGASPGTLPGTLPGWAPADAKLPVDAAARARSQVRWWWAAGGVAILSAVGAWALLGPAPAGIEPPQPAPVTLAAPAATQLPGVPSIEQAAAPASSPSTPGPSISPVPPPAAPVPALSTPASATRPVPPTAARAPAASAPAPATASRPAPATPLPKKTAVLPTEGLWRGQLACAAVLSNPGGAGNGAFKAELEIHVQGRDIRWSRDTALVGTRGAGSFDAQGNFSAEGRGARKDRAEAWLEQASGSYAPSTGRIEGRMQILRTKDRSVARECTFIARHSAASGAPASPALPAAQAASSPQTLGLLQGAWKGRVACGASLSANVPAAVAAAYRADLAIEITGSRISLLRDQASLEERAVGEVDGQGRFSASGYGAYKNKKGDWLVRASGEYLPGARRIEGRMQLFRTQDNGLARECSLVAERR
jgi:hypothetical protein